MNRPKKIECKTCTKKLKVEWEPMFDVMIGHSYCKKCKEFNVHASGEPEKVLVAMQIIEEEMQKDRFFH